MERRTGVPRAGPSVIARQSQSGTSGTPQPPIRRGLLLSGTSLNYLGDKALRRLIQTFDMSNRSSLADREPGGSWPSLTEALRFSERTARRIAIRFRTACLPIHSDRGALGRRVSPLTVFSMPSPLRQTSTQTFAHRWSSSLSNSELIILNFYLVHRQSLTVPCNLSKTFAAANDTVSSVLGGSTWRTANSGAVTDGENLWSNQQRKNSGGPK